LYRFRRLPTTHSLWPIEMEQNGIGFGQDLFRLSTLLDRIPENDFSGLEPARRRADPNTPALLHPWTKEDLQKTMGQAKHSRSLQAASRKPTPAVSFLSSFGNLPYTTKKDKRALSWAPMGVCAVIPPRAARLARLPVGCLSRRRKGCRAVGSRASTTRLTVEKDPALSLHPVQPQLIQLGIS
jgi:hypothetical protein